MAKQTSNLGFVKPDINDFYDIRIQNNNWDKIDIFLDEFQKCFNCGMNDVYGVEVDFEKNTFVRLATANNKKPGVDFDSANAFGGRKRCNLTDNGVVSAYYGDDNYTETGVNSSGESVQVMVEQPKFYYRVVPLEFDDYGLKKARYYISDTIKNGFKIHPAFVLNSKEVDYIYLSAYEGCLQKTSDKSYILDNSQGGFSMNTYNLASIANAAPATGYGSNMFLSCAELRLEYDVGWFMSSIYSISATQLLFLIEYATFNIQNALGSGITTRSSTSLTGFTSSLGNRSGASNGAVSYRGEENLFGNVWTWVDKITALRSSGKVKIDGTTTSIPFTIKGSGFISRFAYDEKYDWIFFPSAIDGNTLYPVGDKMYAENTVTSTTFFPLMGGCYSDNTAAGLFALSVQEAETTSANNFGARLMYIPAS